MKDEFLTTILLLIGIALLFFLWFLLTYSMHHYDSCLPDFVINAF